MSAAPRPGWYPDPAGTPELYRWWDGAGWTDAISESPRAPSPRLHSPARPGDDLVRRRPSTFRTAVALLVCLALFLSATIGLGLAIWGDGPGVQRGSRAPTDSASGAAGPAVGGAAVGRLDEATRVATLGPASMTLPGHPYVPAPDPQRVRGLLDVCFVASAPVHLRYDGGRSWTAAVLFGRLSPEVAGPGLEDRGRRAVEQLGRVLFGSTRTRVEPLEVAQHAVDGHAGVLVRARVHYTVEHLPSRYDDLTALLVGLDDGSVILAASSVPDDADRQLTALAAEALSSLALS
ncbi:MAG: hypothetical protein AVDCRST_MAG61-2149 [uncultured Friedmanniella sp.]|uniref:DUF2510 domain-containing protein n=1 Tax=uncultured Friedmanniella sp. TaxID=335381 RepID=A0A6J4KZU5_9ACTN|nr:DUF2510 domain-containing protein [uncultured Friedmanniella sp.]CAA9318396.1 MAG: hypothetical protein AVDCRST_MAG61-2149 [uncultured Friedmanniella sp.]